MTTDYDCIVIGAGPAGSTAAALIAQQGPRTLLLERDAMPRFHVGESLMPETYWTLERLGVWDQLKQGAYVKKVGVQFVTAEGKETRPFIFSEHDSRESSETWHVRRSEFDRLLYENATAKGAECRDRTRVRDVRLDQPEPEVTIQTVGEPEQRLTTRVVVDATGQQALLANRLGLREVNPELKKAAIWTYFRGGQRYCEESDLTTILNTSDKKCWFWYIPMEDDLVSVGLVGDHEYLLRDQTAPRVKFTSEMAKCPRIQERLATAAQIEDFRVAKEFSYSTREHAGPGWVLIGDAYGFIDPVYSSGVFLALKSGELAADAIVEGLRNNDTSAAQLSKWCTDFDRGVHWIRKLVRAFYTSDFSFGQFMKSHPEHQGNLTDILIGRVFHDGAGKIFDDMDHFIEDQAVS